MIPALLFALLATADPCVQASPLPPDLASAQAYREVGDAHLAAGEDALAAFAYREALRRTPDPAGKSALTRSLEEACHPGPSAFERGQSKLAAGDLAGAAALFETARETTQEPAAALMEGVVLFQLGREVEARPLFEEAALDPAVEGSARFFLGLIALHRGDRDRARAFFDAARADPSLAQDALTLSELTRADGRLQLSLVAESRFDSNPSLLPAAAVQAGRADVGAQLLGLLLARPFGDSGPYARLSAVGALQASHEELDLAGGSAAAGWRQGAGSTFALGEYAFAGNTLDGAPYLLSHTLLAQGQLALGPWLLGASGHVQSRAFQPADAAPYSGWLERARGYAGRRLGERAVLLVGYRFTRDAVRLPELSYVEHAPWAELRFAFSPRVRLVVEADWAVRLYDGEDPLLGLTRSDHLLEGGLGAELDLTPRFTARLAASGTHQGSDAAAFDYDAVTVSLGLQYTAGFF